MRPGCHTREPRDKEEVRRGGGKNARFSRQVIRRNSTAPRSTHVPVLEMVSPVHAV
jgi:hypothetical protein